MNTRFTLSAVVTIIGALGFGFISFLGYLYLKQGDYIQSSLYAGVITVVLVVLAFIAAKFKKARFNFRKNGIKELLFLSIYIVVAFFSMVSFTHFFTIQNKKDEIGSIVKKDIDNVRNMFVMYEQRVNTRIEGFDGFLETLIAGKNTNRKKYLEYFSDPGPKDKFQKNQKLSMFKDDLRPDDYDTMKVIALDWLKKSEKIVLDVKPFGLMEVIGDFENNAKGWYKKIQSYDQTVNTFPDEDIDEDFTYNLSFASVTEELTKVEKPSVMGILLFLLAHVLILFVYFMAIRDGKSKGLFRELFSTSNTDENDDSITL